MSDPTIRLSTCRQDGRCPECDDECPESLARHPCGCSWCYSRGCNDAHTRALLTEALRQRDACQSGVCSEIEMLRAEVERLRHWRDDESANFGMSREVCAALREERDAAIRERDLARAHDAQPYPTAEAYERVCAALEQAKSLADFWEAEAVKHSRGERAIKAERESNQTAYIHSLQSELHVERGRNRDLLVEVWKAQERADRAEALLRECETVLDELYDNRTSGPALLAKIRETTKVEEP